MRTTIYIYILICTVAAVCSLIISEGALRFYHIRPRVFAARDGMIQPAEDPLVGYEFVPNENGINALGFRGEQIEAKPSALEFRIIVLGDSVAYGCCEIPLASTFPKELERYHIAVNGKTLRIFNAGVVGYNTIQEAQYYKNRLAALHPDLIVLQITLNDYLPITYEFDGLVVASKSKKDAAAAYLYGQISERFRALVRRSYVAQHAVYALAVLSAQSSPADAFQNVLGAAVSRNDPSLIVRYRLDTVDWQKSHIIGDGMSMLRHHAGDIPVVAVIFPYFEKDMLQYPDEYKLLHETIAKQARQRGIIPFDLLPCFQTPDTSYGQEDMVHPNEAGHKKAAEGINHFLEEKQLL